MDAGAHFSNDEHLLGDAEFAVGAVLISPFRRNNTRYPHNFNLRLSRARVVVENAIGILKQRFRGIDPIRLRGRESQRVLVLAGVILHNFLQGRGETVDFSPSESLG